MNERLSSIPLFEGLEQSQLKELSTIAVEQTFEKGRQIFSEGDEGAGFYVVMEGRVKIYKISWEGKEQILHIFGRGEPFGEVPVFAGQRFPASAESMEESRLLFFPRESFIRSIGNSPDLAMGMLAVLSKRLRKFALLIEDLSLKEVPGRLAAHLLYLNELHEGMDRLELDISKGQLASLLGTIPETLSRILRKMKEERLIETEGAVIRILDEERLRDIAESGARL